MLLVQRRQGAQPHPAQSRSKTRPTRGTREFCPFVEAEACGGQLNVPVVTIGGAPSPQFCIARANEWSASWSSKLLQLVPRI
jgi:hypothetical protein